MIELTKVLLNNLTIIMVYMRNDISNKENIIITSILLDAFCDNINNDQMCDNIALTNVPWNSQLKRDIDNCSESCNEYYKHFIVETLLFFKDLLFSKQYKVAYQMADILHVLPDVILDNEKKSKKDFWKTFIIPFEKNNDISFFKGMKNEFIK